MGTSINCVKGHITLCVPHIYKRCKARTPLCSPAASSLVLSTKAKGGLQFYALLVLGLNPIHAHIHTQVCKHLQPGTSYFIYLFVNILGNSSHCFVHSLHPTGDPSVLFVVKFERVNPHPHMLVEPDCFVRQS